MKTEPINVTIGRLRTSIRYNNNKPRQLELLEIISDWVKEFGVKHPEEVIAGKKGDI